MKKTLYLLIVLCLLLGLTACNNSQGNGTEKSSTEIGKGSEIVNDSETSSENETSSEPEKVYDLYVNGVGYDVGVTLEFEVTLTAPDTEFAWCCPSLNIYKEGVTDPAAIQASIEFKDEPMNELLISNKGDYEYKDTYYSYWSYIDVMEMFVDPTNGKPLDCTNGLYLYSPQITFKEAGNYTITVTSGNGYSEMAEEFAKYDNCFSIKVKVLE